MKFKEFDINIKEYIGRMGPGVVVVLSIIHDMKVYEGMYWYTDKQETLEFPEEIENSIGTKIDDHVEYNNIMGYLKEIRSEYVEIAPKLKDLV